MSIKFAILENLKAKKKYNTLELKYDVLKEQYDEKVLELNAQIKARKIERNKYKETIKEYIDEVAKLEEKIKKLKKKK